MSSRRPQKGETLDSPVAFSHLPLRRQQDRKHKLTGADPAPRERGRASAALRSVCSLPLPSGDVSKTCRPVGMRVCLSESVNSHSHVLRNRMKRSRLSRAKSNDVESSRAEPQRSGVEPKRSGAEPSRAKPSRAERSEVESSRAKRRLESRSPVDEEAQLSANTCIGERLRATPVRAGSNLSPTGVAVEPSAA